MADATDYEIYKINPDGSGRRRITDNEADDYDAAWSPDGKRVVYMRFDNVTEQIYKIRADGTGRCG